MSHPLEHERRLPRPAAAPYARRARAAAALLAACALGAAALPGSAQQPAPAASAPAGVAPGKPALSVSLVSPRRAEVARRIAANGSIVARQEASVGAEVAGLRLAELAADVGQRVRAGQLLARLADATVRVELEQAQAALAEATAVEAEARQHAERARSVEGSGAVSAQQLAQLASAAQAAQARLAAARAQLKAAELRLAHTRIVAPADGVVAARQGQLGMVVQPGQELFRLIVGGRIEWRAELPAAELAKLQPGLAAEVLAPSGARAAGRVRLIAPTVDAQTRMAAVYVELPPRSLDEGQLKPGMFAKGEIAQPAQQGALVLPQTAVSLRDGFATVFVVGADQRAQQRKVRLGARVGSDIEIVDGVKEGERVVASGAAFLSDGDRVRVVGP
jgi:RND family efflux transporter MFP subunit